VPGDDYGRWTPSLGTAELSGCFASLRSAHRNERAEKAEGHFAVAWHQEREDFGDASSGYIEAIRLLAPMAPSPTSFRSGVDQSGQVGGVSKFVATARRRADPECE
jgi:hypothetical protein